ncbi:MmcQ/YjbR family DNA-binding protein [Qaidamihabitans albus]|uniref:MmcQ/YjbR family DNA-binding protein n=1 Tax=Qaidamihabitans albus TaxID=2795733 RepID=UPI0018F21F79|nr:MmcQ/YjbR family DNA-binding protein [Qaidamihabitans albus]
MADWDTVCRLAERLLPELEHSTSYHTPALKVRGKLFARLREDGESIVVFVDQGERDALLTENPGTFFITPHYENYPTVLITLANVDEDQLGELLVESWRRKAPKRALRALDDAGD